MGTVVVFIRLFSFHFMKLSAWTELAAMIRGTPPLRQAS